MQILAHRGYHQDHPENSICAFMDARRNGFHGIETDLRITVDRQIVVCHDDIIPSNFNIYGTISNSKCKNLVKAGMPTLESLFDALPEEVALHLEIKSPGLANILIERYKSKLQSRINCLFVTSFWHKEILMVKQQMPEIKTGMIFVGRPLDKIFRSMFLASLNDAIVMPLEMIDKKITAVLHYHKRQLFSWGVKSISQIRHAKNMGIDLVYSDAPFDLELKELLKRAD